MKLLKLQRKSFLTIYIKLIVIQIKMKKQVIEKNKKNKIITEFLIGNRFKSSSWYTSKGAIFSESFIRGNMISLKNQISKEANGNGSDELLKVLENYENIMHYQQNQLKTGTKANYNKGIEVFNIEEKGHNCDFFIKNIKSAMNIKYTLNLH